MKRSPVDSTSARTIGYDPARRELDVEFHSGRVYRYFDVPATTYDALLKAPSIGRFLNAHIRNDHRFERR